MGRTLTMSGADMMRAYSSFFRMAKRWQWKLRWWNQISKMMCVKKMRASDWNGHQSIYDASYILNGCTHLSSHRVIFLFFYFFLSFSMFYGECSATTIHKMPTHSRNTIIYGRTTVCVVAKCRVEPHLTEIIYFLFVLFLFYFNISLFNLHLRRIQHAP